MRSTPVTTPAENTTTRRHSRALRLTSIAGVLGITMAAAPVFTSTLGSPAAAPAVAARPVSSDISHRNLSEFTKDKGRVQQVAADAALGARAKAVALPTKKAGRAAYGKNTAAPAAGVSSTGTDSIVTLPVEGGLVGLSWPADQAPSGDTTVAWRSQKADGSWTDWTPVAVNADMVDPEASKSNRQARTSTDPFWIGEEAKSLQLRYASGDAAVGSARVEQINSKADTKVPASVPTTTPAGSAQALAAKPRIFSRAEWGADESLRNGCVPTVQTSLKGVVIHHDAGTNNYTAAQSAGIVRSILSYHTQVNGWCDMGYNVVVDKYGQAFEGRMGGLNQAVQGAHALGFNDNSFGISMLGNYDTAQPTSAGIDILTRVIAWRLDGVYVPANGTTVWRGGAKTTKYPTVGNYTLPTVITHRDVNYTACPGANLYAYLPTIRSRAAALQTYRNDPVYQTYMATGGPARWGAVQVTVSYIAPRFEGTIFTSGARFYLTPSYGVKILGAAIAHHWMRNGGPSKWGYPTSHEAAVPTGAYANWERGRVLTRTTSGYTAFVEGGIRMFWTDRLGGPKAHMGVATSPMYSDPVMWYQHFNGGTIYFEGLTRRPLHTQGGMDTYYRRNGFLTGPMGRVTGPLTYTSTGASQTFANGTLTWNRTTGAVVFTKR